jgi:predicted site-specific integrase-resolvase
MSRTMRSTPENQAPNRSLFSIVWAAGRLGVSAFTVRRLIQRGALKSVRIACRVMIPDVEIERAIKHGCER